MRLFLLGLLALMFSTVAFAFDPQVVAESITAFGNSLTFMESSAVIMVVTFIVDFIAKKFPTKNPVGVVHATVKILKGIAAIFNALIMIVDAFAAFLDKVVSQNLKK